MCILILKKIINLAVHSGMHTCDMSLTLVMSFSVSTQIFA